MSKYHRNEKIETVEMADELGMLNIETGQYYVLDSVGLDVWNLLEKPSELNSIVENLLKMYSVDYKTCNDDVEVLLNSMQEKQLILEV